MKSWHYEKDGQRHGAVSNIDIDALINQREIDGRTLVWTDGFLDWTPLAQTELAAYLKASGAPPALPGNKINNTVVWILALAPLIGFLLQCFIAGMSNDADSMSNEAFMDVVQSSHLGWVTLVLNLGLSWLDEKNLKKAGIDTTKFGKTFILIPIYLWKRAKSLNQSPAYFWVWMATFALTLFAKI